MACYRYNTTVHEATDMKPFRAMYGAGALEFDAEVSLQNRTDDAEKAEEDLVEELAGLRRRLLGRGYRARTCAARTYDHAGHETYFEKDDRILFRRAWG